MPHATAKDGVKLYYEAAGSGTPLLFIHEFAGDYRSWEPQMRFFARYFRCIAFNARGFPPSDVPEDPARYSQAHARDDVIAVLDHLKLDRTHIVGLSMGGFAALHAGIAYPERARSLVIAGCGYGAEPDTKEKLTHAGAVPEQGPARLGRVRPPAPRAFAERPGAHHARRADAAPLAVGAGRRHEENRRADAHHHRRRG
jgi:pimeloyl-ACP methyl ester carboxylesterase